MKDSIKYNTGATGLAGSLGGESEQILSSGFSVETQARINPWDAGFVREDDGGTNSVGDRYEFSKTGACGRPSGYER